MISRMMVLLFAALLLGCPAQPPAPPVTTTTTLAPAPELCFAPVPSSAGDYVGVEPRTTELLATVLLIRDEIGRYDCWPDYEDVPLEMAASGFRRAGMCAIKEGDRVIVQRTDGFYEEWHLIRYDTGCWASAERAYKGTLAFIGAAK